MIGGNLSLVFPGQGSQKPKMLSTFFENSKFKDTFKEASSIIGIDLIDLVINGDKDVLAKTEITQPLMLTAGIAMWRILPPKLISKIKFLAGHSLGEFSALVAADSISFENGLNLVTQRAKFMQEAVPLGKGGIAAIIGLPLTIINDTCKKITTINNDLLVSPANLNSPNQTVISGTKKGIDLAINQLKEQGAKMAVSLPMSVPAHCSLMIEASEKFALLLENLNLKEPSIPIIQNVTAQNHCQVEEIKDNLSKHLYSPVKWLDTILLLKAQKIKTILECGPGKVLSNLNKQIFSECDNLPLDNIEYFNKLIEQYSE